MFRRQTSNLLKDLCDLWSVVQPVNLDQRDARRAIDSRHHDRVGPRFKRVNSGRIRTVGIEFKGSGQRGGGRKFRLAAGIDPNRRFRPPCCPPDERS